MTLFLASVADADEAETAVRGGADLVDLKDAAQGALGALPSAAVRAAVAAVAGRRPVSAVTGDLPMQPGAVVAAASAMAQAGVDYVKVGLFPGPLREECMRALAGLARQTRLVGVLFADAGPDDDLVPLMAQCGFAAAMLDTARKGAGNLLDHRDVTSLLRFIGRCRDHGMMAGLAGALEAPDVPRLLLLRADYLGFRGALCAGQDRRGPIDAGRVRMIRELIPLDPRAAREPPQDRPDYRLLAARSYAAEPDKDDMLDRIFVHDLVLPVRIGAYAREHEKPQNVRFNVDVMIARSGHAVEDMRDVVSYDLIMDGIRLIVARGHTPLVETLAERIAELLLAHPRAVRVTVRVEKLELGPGGVGAEITRARSTEIAKVYQLYPAAAGRANAAE
jgi:dihydroneopterin aldolase